MDENFSKIQKVVFSSVQNRLNVIVNASANTEEIQKIKDMISTKIGSTLDIIITKFDSSSLEEIMNEKWELVVLEVVKELPAVKPFLLSAKREILDLTKINISLSNSWGLNILQQLKCDKILTRICQNLFCQELEFAFSINHTVEKFDTDKIDSDALNKIRGAILVKQTEKNPQEILLGRNITKEARTIFQVIEEERNVIINGEIFALELQVLKSGRKLLTFEITDYTDSISVKMFLDEKTDALSTKMANGLWVKIKGLVQHDKYSHELTMFPTDIMRTIQVLIEDKAELKRVEFHLHTKMSALDSVAEIKDIFKTASKWGHKAVAITDHGVVQAFPEAYEQGKKLGIKVIYGVEGYLICDENEKKEKQRNYHIIILAKNMTGLYNLYRLITISHLEHFYRRPRIPKSDLMKYRDGLIIGSACEAGEVYQALINKVEENKLIEIASFYDYLEIQPIGNNEFMIEKGLVKDKTEIQNLNSEIYRLGVKINKPVIATCDVHFVNPRDAVFRQILMAGKGFQDDTQAPLHFRNTEDMLSEFAYLGEEIAYEVVVENTIKLADGIEDLKPIPDEFFPPEIEGAEEQITSMTMTRAHELYGDILPDVVRLRLDKELNSIIKHGFAVLYLIAQKLVKKSNDDGYLVGSRGSVGSSFVATMTGITEVNPLPPHYLCPECKHVEFILDGSIGSGADLPEKECSICSAIYIREGHDIPFEVFLGFEGDKVPDIDLNFSGEYQPRAHKYVEELFGKNNVFRAGTIATIAEKTAFGFVKNYLTEKNIQARGSEIKRLIKGCSGVKRTTGQHPGGIMVVPNNVDIHQFTPLQKPADDTKSDVITTHFDYHSISARLVKLDILGHDDPTVIKMLEDLTGVNAKTISIGEPTTMKIFSSVDVLNVTPENIRSNIGTYGIPEFGTKFVRQMLEDTRPKTFSELVRISGFSHGTDVWINNAQDLIKSDTAKLSEAISTRDDIMVYLLYKGLPPIIAFKIMEDVRKGKGVKPEYEAEMNKNNVAKWYIDSCKKIKYMFPKAHAVAYVTMAFRIAYYKVFYPQAFYATFFTVRADEFDADLICKGEVFIRKAIENIERKGNDATQKEKNLLSILELALEMYHRKIKLLNVDLEKSEAVKFQITPEGILPPFSALQGVGANAAVNIVQARNLAPFKSIEDLKIRSKIAKNVIEALVNHGTLGEIPETAQLTLF